MAGKDGSINFDTSINTKGFNAGIQKIKSGMAGIGKALSAGLLGALVAISLIITAIVGLFSGALSVLKKVTKYSKDIDQLKASFNQLSGSLASAFAPIIAQIIPILQRVVGWLVSIINTVSMVIAAFLGQKTVMQAVASSTSSASDASGALASNTKKAGKAAKGALAAFDELNVLQQKEDSGGSGGGGGTSFKEVAIDPKTLATVETIKAWIKQAWEDVKNWAIGAWNDILNFLAPIWLWVYDNVILPIWEKLQWLWSVIKDAFTAFWEGGLKKSLVGIIEFLKGFFLGQLDAFWKMIEGIFKTLLLAITGIVNGVIQVIGGIIQFLTGVFTGNWKLAWEGIKNIFFGIFNSITAFIGGAINLMIGLINGMISGIIAGLNTVITAMNTIRLDIPSWIPGLGGKSFGINLKQITAPQIPLLPIPKLASGAVIPPNAEFAAILGDQRSGTNIETPESLLREIVRDELGQQNISVSFEGSLGALVRELEPVIKRENNRLGGSLISGVTA